MPVSKLAESLYSNNHSRHNISTVHNCLINLLDNLPTKSWQIFKQFPIIPKIYSQYFGNGKYKLTMLNLFTNFFLYMVGNCEDSFLWSTRTEQPLFTGKRHKILFTTVTTSYASKPLSDIATVRNLAITSPITGRQYPYVFS